MLLSGWVARTSVEWREVEDKVAEVERRNLRLFRMIESELAWNDSSIRVEDQEGEDAGHHAWRLVCAAGVRIRALRREVMKLEGKLDAGRRWRWAPWGKKGKGKKLG